MQKTLLSLILLAACFLTATAQRQWDRPMQLKKCTINISADPFTATTYIEMEFYNPNDSEIEGLHRFQLQPGQAITAFQLDLYGKFRDGSIEEKWKAANAYNTIVGKRIDPALLQWDGYNSYSLRIYPIAARGTRRVSMTIQQAMKAGKESIDYLLPLNIADTVDEFSALVQVGGTTHKPIFRGGLLQGRFSSAREDHQFRASFHKILLNRPISFSLPLLGNSDFCTRTKDNTTYFALRYQPSGSTEYDFSPKRVTVFWDVSASGNTRNVEKEISLLKQYISYYSISQLTIIPFNYRLQDTAVFYPSGGDSRWDNYLRSRQYDGATQLGVIDLSTLKDDAILLFTDGNNSYGRDMPMPGNAYLYCISSNNTNHPHLDRIIGESGGRVIDLEKTRISEAITVMGKAKQLLLDIQSASGKTVIDHQSLLPEAGQLMLAGTLGGFMDTLLFVYGNNNRKDRVEKLVITRSSSCFSPALDRLEALLEFDAIVKQHQWDKMLAFGRKERIVTPNTSYIVLERVEDYVRYNIEPPKELEEECLQQGYVKREPVPVKQLTQMDVLRDVTAMYNHWIRMWDSQAAPINPSAPVSSNTAVNTKEDRGGAPVAANIEPAVADKERSVSHEGLNEVVVTSYSSMRKQSLGSVVVRSDEISRGGFTSVEQALQGRVAGIQISSGNGFAASPGSQLSNIRIRGLNSLNNNSLPLYVLDGVPVSGSLDNLLNVNDVEKITVLKDAQATALYGSSGANGVILIETKKGRYQRNYYYDHNKPYKLKNMEDVDYLKELKQVGSLDKISKYRELQQSYGNEPGFYLDAAQHLFETGFVSEAVAALTNAAEASHGSMAVLKAIAFMLDEWKQYDEAIRLLEGMRQTGGGIEAVRNLALAWHRKGNHQK
ncbi:MAG TPA: TonB-dependent receptor plug domain-containing protein, partial [Flavisolibacter sp.]